MNYYEGGRRLLIVCVILNWVVVGGVLASIYGEPPPEMAMPYEHGSWLSLMLGVSVGAIVCAHLTYDIFSSEAKNMHGALGLVIALWGMCATFGGWLSSLFLLMAAVGGWEPPVPLVYRNFLASAVGTVALSLLIFVGPGLVILFFAWLAGGFSASSTSNRRD